MRKLALLITVLIGPAFAVPAAAQTNRFMGVCDLQGVRSQPWTSTASTGVGDGTCTGTLDGAQITDEPVHIEVALDGHGLAGGPPVIANGFGTISFPEHGASFPLAFNVVGTIVYLTSACFGCGGRGIAIIDIVTPTPVTDDAYTDRTALHIVAATVQELSNGA